MASLLFHIDSSILPKDLGGRYPGMSLLFFAYRRFHTAPRYQWVWLGRREREGVSLHLDSSGRDSVLLVQEKGAVVDLGRQLILFRIVTSG